jgi:short-subunit dehydrogenase
MNTTKAILTGHTRGLGAALADLMLSRGIAVLGVSRTRGATCPLQRSCRKSNSISRIPSRSANGLGLKRSRVLSMARIPSC